MKFTKKALCALTGFALLGMNATIVMAQDGQILKVANPAFNQDWSPLRGGVLSGKYSVGWETPD